MLLSTFLAISAVLHPVSVSSSRVVVDGAKVEVRMRCQVATLLECLPIDRDGDRLASAPELEAARDRIESYILAGYRIHGEFVEAGESGERDQELRGKMETMVVSEGVLGPLTPREALVDCVFRFEAPSPLRAIRIDFDLFRESDPLHRHHAEIVWNGAEPEARVLWVEDPTWTFPASQRGSSGALRAFVALGIEHILTGYDHIAFLVALVVASRRLRSIVAVVTAFTLAHSITLALASFEVVRVPAIVVEPAIAASIAYVAIRNVFAKRTRALWPEAFGFGLIHGLGFAGSIQATLASEPRKLTALFGFNLGVEIGQLAIVTAIGVSIALLRSLWKERLRAGSEPWLVPRALRVGASSVVAVLGVYWFVTRIVSS